MFTIKKMPSPLCETDPAMGAAGTFKPADATTIKVYPPGSFTADLGFFSLPSCTAPGHVYLNVSVLRPGTNI